MLTEYDREFIAELIKRHQCPFCPDDVQELKGMAKASRKFKDAGQTTFFKAFWALFLLALLYFLPEHFKSIFQTIKD